VPDPLNSPVYQPGDTLEVPEAQVQYTGLVAHGSQLVARFRVMSGTLADGARLQTPDGTLVALPPGSGTLDSAPFGLSSSPPRSDETLTLVLGDRLYVLAAGNLG
jgi:hypothetical protein